MTQLIIFLLRTCSLFPPHHLFEELAALHKKGISFRELAGSQVCLSSPFKLVFQTCIPILQCPYWKCSKGWIPFIFPQESWQTPALGDRRQPGHRERRRVSQKHGSPAALLYGARPAPSRCRRPKPANMTVTSCFSRGVAVLAGWLLLSFGSLAASQIEVGARPSERPGPGRTAVSGPRAPRRCPSDTQKRREASWSPFASFGAAWDVGRVSRRPGAGHSQPVSVFF